MSTNLQMHLDISAPIGEVWEAWTEPEVLTLWDPDRVDGELELGERVVFHWDSFGVSLPVQIAELVEGERLCLRAQRPDGLTQDLVVALAKIAGGTRVSLTIKGIHGEDDKRGTLSGWHCQLRILARFLSIERPIERRCFAALGPAVVSAEHAFLHFANPSPWLARNAVRFTQEGQSYSIVTPEGVALQGEVLALVPDRELVLWWQEAHGVIRFRALPIGGGSARLVGAQVQCWRETPQVETLRFSLHASVDRLLVQLGAAIGNA